MNIIVFWISKSYTYIILLLNEYTFRCGSDSQIDLDTQLSTSSEEDLGNAFFEEDDLCHVRALNMLNSEENIFFSSQSISDAHCYKNDTIRMLPSGDNENMNRDIPEDLNVPKSRNPTINNENKKSPKTKQKRTVFSDQNLEFNNPSQIHRDIEYRLTKDIDTDISPKAITVQDGINIEKKPGIEFQHRRISERYDQDGDYDKLNEKNQADKVSDNIRKQNVENSEPFLPHRENEQKGNVGEQEDNPSLLKVPFEAHYEKVSCSGNRKRHSSGIPRKRQKLQSQQNWEYNLKKFSPFDLLSDEIVIKIFEFVPRTLLLNGCALTCKRLRNICYDDTLWKRIDLGGKTFGPGQAGKIILRGTKILRMAKTTVQPPLFSNDTDQNHSKHLFNALPNEAVSATHHSSRMELKLKYLDLSFSTIEETCLESLFQKCHNLKKVSLENCNLNDRILHYLSQNKTLDVLDMQMAVGITDQGLSYLAQGLRNTLVDVNLSWIGMDEDVIEEALLLLANNSQTLRSLNIAGCKDALTDDRLHFILGI